MSRASRDVQNVYARRYRERIRLGLPSPKRTPDERFWSRVDKSGECWLWRGRVGTHGYGAFYLAGAITTAHRAAWLLSGGSLLPGQQLRHYVCDNPLCVRPAHFLPGTAAENAADMVAHGRQRRGVEKPLAKLTDVAVRDIRQRLAAGDRQVDVARRFGVDSSTIRSLVRGKTWRHVQP